MILGRMSCHQLASWVTQVLQDVAPPSYSVGTKVPSHARCNRSSAKNSTIQNGSLASNHVGIWHPAGEVHGLGVFKESFPSINMHHWLVLLNPPKNIGELTIPNTGEHEKSLAPPTKSISKTYFKKQPQTIDAYFVNDPNAKAHILIKTNIRCNLSCPYLHITTCNSTNENKRKHVSNVQASKSM